MSSLNAVVDELQSQNQTLTDVKDSIRAMLDEEVKRRKSEERSRGDKEEERREKSNQKSRQRQQPRSFTQGLAQGSGISSITDMLKGFGGVLGGASLGGLLGLAAGKLFVPVLTGLLGANYLSKWVKPLTDRLFGDGATIEAFGKEIKVEEIGGAIAGVVGMLLAPALIKKTLTTTFGIGAATGRLLLSRVIGKMGIGAAVSAAGDAAGDLIKEAADPEEVKKRTRKSTRFKKFAQLFKMAGSGLVRLTIPGAIIGTAFAGAYLMAEYIENKREEMLKDLQDDMDKRLAEIPALIKNKQTQIAANSMASALASMGEGTVPNQADVALAKEAISTIDDPIQRQNLSKMADALATPKPPTLQLDAVNATAYATTQLAASVAALDETLIKRIEGLPSFEQLPRLNQEGILAAEISKLGLSTSGVNPAQLASDFLKRNYSTTQNINIVNEGNSVSYSGGGSSKVSSDMGRAVDYYWFDKHMSRQYMGIKGSGMYGY